MFERGEATSRMKNSEHPSNPRNDLAAQSPATAGFETIAAIATPVGAGGIGVVRVSGRDALAIAASVLGRSPTPRYAHYLRFKADNGEVIDDGLLLAFPAPNSFTGEDVVELQAHGSPVVLAALVQRCLSLGARPARPGEFSERAYLNGKLDLIQAEAVADLIAAGSMEAARAARRSLDGVFSARVHALADAVLKLRVYLEAAIDFPEEEIDFLRTEEVRARFASIESDLTALLAAARTGRRLRDGLHIVVLGAPNVGKSSLLNALAGSDRAIVSAVAGTTRDVLREWVDVGGVPVTIVDTAGLREHSDDAIEREGMRRAQAEAQRADLALLVIDAGDPSSQPVPTHLDAIVVRNKIDLLEEAPRREQREGIEIVHLSARKEAGLELLRDAILGRAGVTSANGTFSARTRHLHALELAQNDIAMARTQASDGVGELAAESLRYAHAHLGDIVGRVDSDQLLGEIFASFCIGK